MDKTYGEANLKGPGAGPSVSANATLGHFITGFRIGYHDGADAGLTFLQGVLDDGSLLAPVGQLSVFDQECEISAKGCITTITGRAGWWIDDLAGVAGNQGGGGEWTHKCEDGMCLTGYTAEAGSRVGSIRFIHGPIPSGAAVSSEFEVTKASAKWVPSAAEAAAFEAAAAEAAAAEPAWLPSMVPAAIQKLAKRAAAAAADAAANLTAVKADCGTAKVDLRSKTSAASSASTRNRRKRAKTARYTAAAAAAAAAELPPVDGVLASAPQATVSVVQISDKPGIRLEATDQLLMSAEPQAAEDKQQLLQGDKRLLEQLTEEGNELLLLQLQGPLAADDEQQLHQLLGKHGFFSLRKVQQGEVFATSSVVQALFLGASINNSSSSSSTAQVGTLQGQKSASGGAGSSSGGGGSASGQAQVARGLHSLPSDSGTAAQPDMAQQGSMPDAMACSMLKLCNAQPGVPPRNSLNVTSEQRQSAVSCLFALDAQQAAGIDSELWFDGTDGEVKATVMGSAHVCLKGHPHGDAGKLCIKLRGLKGIIGPAASSSSSSAQWTNIGVQALYISVAATVDGRLVHLQLDMPKGAVQKLPERCQRASKGGWVLQEGSLELGRCASGPSVKAGCKLATEKAEKPEPGKEFTATYAYEPACHLLDDLPPSLYRPVSMVLLRDEQATRLCDPSGRELDRIASPSAAVFQIVGDISNITAAAQPGTPLKIEVVLAVELAWLVMRTDTPSHSFKCWQGSKLKAAKLEEVHTLLESVTTGVQQTNRQGEC